MASAWRVTSRTRMITPRQTSSHMGPSLVAHWKPELQWSLISLRYWTPLVASTRRLGPVPSGPKAQILRISPTSRPKSSARMRARALNSSRGPTLPSSMATSTPSGIGIALQKRRLCLFTDLDKQTMEDSSVTVSRYETTGSEILMGAPPMKSSARSLRQISRCNSPAPATMCSPDSSVWQRTRGSDLARRLRPSTSLGRSWGFLTSTATRTTGDTEYFI
mmetsp:Transcript_18273/g.35907  ORF Transcript_18273/g.35907 Transcript_18273/m.35907 type:complete len:220 (-) Transcript_18273:128-787(-)